MDHNDTTSRLRRLIYAVLITVSVGMAMGRILGAERVYEPSLYRAYPGEKALSGNWPSQRPPALPTFSSNDRSRWAMIRSLVDHGTFIIGKRDRKLLEPSAAALLAAGDPLQGAVLAISGRNIRIAKTRCTWHATKWERGWDTVDKVLRPDTQEFYSSKPPLLPTLVSILYWLLQIITGWTLGEHVWQVVKSLLLVINVIPFAIYLFLLSRLAERFATTDWSRIFIVAAGCFATLVTPWLVTFNNHTVATFSVLFALYPTLQVLTAAKNAQLPWYSFALAGVFASFAACNELPALAFTAGIGLFLWLRSPRQTLAYFLPAAVVPIVAFLAVNYIAIGQWKPAYAQFGTIWYEYEGSHWGWPPGTKQGIDYAREHENRLQYAFHFFIGHHGLFSLTPLWLLTIAGMLIGLVSRKRKRPEKITEDSNHQNLEHSAALPRYFYANALLLSLIVITFYLIRTDNYGGWSAGLRWLMWLTPIWLLCLIPILDGLSETRLFRWFAYALLALSVLSVSFPAWNPWRHPWIYRWMNANGWLPY